MKPPRTVYGILNGDVVFHWKFAFGNTHNFQGITWGQTEESGSITYKYIIVRKNGQQLINPSLPVTLKKRLSGTSTISQHEGSWKFVLKNATIQDQQKTYGCAIEVSWNFLRDGPIRIILQSELNYI